MIGDRLVNIRPMAAGKSSYAPDPKPAKRIVEKKGYGGGRAKVIAEGRCRIPWCKERFPWANLDPHHLVQKSLGGDDVAMNIIPLCRIHHDELKHPKRARAVRIAIRSTLTKTEELYIRGKKSREWLERHYAD